MTGPALPPRWPETEAMVYHPDQFKPLDVERLLATGAVAGPYRKTRPARLTLAGRIARTLRALLAYLAGPRAF